MREVREELKTTPESIEWCKRTQPIAHVDTHSQGLIAKRALLNELSAQQVNMSHVCQTIDHSLQHL